ncbi:MAG: hypothetical protein Q8L88_03715 [Bacteroidota bacterium]|nr:hypothetical protein [Bacteroidota bacterium]
MDLVTIEHELKKRFQFPYHWGQKQNNEMDRQTNFIYHIQELSIIIERVQADFSSKSNHQEYFDYALNRWYNFWSAQAVEHIFCSHNNVIPNAAKDKTKDFSINGITFDHKTSVFPRGFGKPFGYATSHKRELIQWLYNNQSQQQRLHFKNRLFIVLHKSDGNHWQLKAEIGLLQRVIKQYLSSFDSERLERFNFEQDSETFSDILWGIG